MNVFSNSFKNVFVNVFPPSQPNLEVHSNRKAAMNKRQLIEAIRKHNTTVDTAFLVQFSEADLGEYLGRLEAAFKKQQLIAGWVRPRSQMRLAS